MCGLTILHRSTNESTHSAYPIACAGGNPAHAWQWNQQHNGSCDEAAYPYDSHHKHHNNSCMSCQPVVNSVVGKIVAVQHNSLALKNAVAQQPVQVGVDAAAKNFHLYHSGVIDPAAHDLL